MSIVISIIASDLGISSFDLLSNPNKARVIILLFRNSESIIVSSSPIELLSSWVSGAIFDKSFKLLPVKNPPMNKIIIISTYVDTLIIFLVSFGILLNIWLTSNNQLIVKVYHKYSINKTYLYNSYT